MTCRLVLAAAALGWSLCAGGAWAASGGRFGGVVERVEDGDSLRVRDGAGRLRAIRLAFIDAPEHDQPYGAEAHRQLRAMALGQAVDVSWKQRDVYGRVVAVVHVRPAGCTTRPCAGGRDLGHALLTGGHAWWYARYATRQPQAARQAYADAERGARARGLGLWRAAAPVPPWAWRAGHRGGPE